MDMTVLNVFVLCMCVCVCVCSFLVEFDTHVNN